MSPGFSPIALPLTGLFSSMVSPVPRSEVCIFFPSNVLRNEYPRSRVRSRREGSGELDAIEGCGGWLREWFQNRRRSKTMSTPHSVWREGHSVRIPCFAFYLRINGRSRVSSTVMRTNVLDGFNERWGPPSWQH